VTGRARLIRGRSHDARRAYPLAMADFRAAAELARQAGDRRLEMMALREQAGDVPLALGMSIVDCTGHLHTGLRIAEGLGDRHNEADMLGRLAVIAANRLHFTDAVGYGRRALHAARMAGEDRVLAIALDGLKTAYAYQGDIGSLVPVLDELEPLLRRQGDLFRLQWAVVEGAFPAVAAGRWDEAIARVREAHAINRRSGYAAYEGWFAGYLGWLHRLRGDLDRALEYGRRALDLTHGSTHAWWRAAACAQSAVTLLAAGRTGEAVALLEEGSGLADRAGAESHLLSCIGPLAEATGSASLLDDADARLRQIQAPEGSAWLLGADAYLAVARAWVARGEPDRAAAVLAPLRTAARRAGWVWLEEFGEVPSGARGAVAFHRTV
jgi:tetratricopeptide (TPR) repeat protein